MSDAQAYTTIEFSAADGVAELTLNRPARLNSFTATMHAELRGALQRVAADPTLRCLVLTGAGRAFCAGQDLDDEAVRPGPDLDIGRTLERHYAPLVLALRALPLPVIAAVNGVAAGAGANVAFACDLVYAARSASFIQAFAKIGLMPDAGGTWFLPRLVGPQRALGLALLGERIDAARAESWGLVWQCVDDAELMPTVRAVAARLAVGPTRAYASTKQAIHAATAGSLQASLDLERDLQRALGRSEDFREGVAAFAAKRAPQFRSA